MSAPVIAAPPRAAGAREVVAKPDFAKMNFDESPFIVIWETTRACDLACLHCRATSIKHRDPNELSTAEAKHLMDEIRRFGQPLVVLTGGDSLKRPDILEIVRHGADIGLRMAITPSGTPLMTPAVLRDLKAAGLARLAVSLDGASPEVHDKFRGVDGSWEWTVDMLRAARELGLSTQINTTISRYNLFDLENLIELMTELGISLWSVFFVVPTGRARVEDLASAEDFEYVFNRLYDLSKIAPFDIKTTAAPHYRRVVLQRQVVERRAGARDAAPQTMTAGLGFSLADGVGRARGVNEGDGFVFVSHTGDIYPSGFLPVSAGNVRRDDLVAVYRTHPMFVALRDKAQLKGKCGACEYKSVCGGSRARAYALTGDWLEADPYCEWQPAKRRKAGRGNGE